MKYYPLALLLLSAFSCDTNHVKLESYDFPIDTIKVDLDLAASSENLISADSIKIEKLIPLETKQESLIGMVSKIKMENDRIYVLDTDIAKALIVFDAKGKYLFKIGKIGNGPGEFFRAPLDFAVDSIRKQIHVFEAESQKIVLFDWDGQFVREVNLHKKNPYAFAFLAPEKYAFAYRTTQANYELAIVSPPDEASFIFGKLDSYLKYTNQYPIMENEGIIYFTPAFSYLACRLDMNGITSAVYFDFGKHNMPEELRRQLKEEFDAKLIKEQQYVLGLRDIMESEAWLYMSFPYGTMRMSYLRNKKDQRNRVGTSLFDCIIPTNIYQIKGECFVIALTSATYEQYQSLKEAHISDAKRYFEKTPTVIHTALSAMQQSDNPVICVISVNN